MNRSWNHLRRTMLSLAFVGTMGFGATQALAAPEQARAKGCMLDGVQVADCTAACRAKGYDVGYCGNGYCLCRSWY
ncbi:MAG TPA: hypothetical protein VHG51_04160 [Longimicrobiaceae bacterium]|nr:hypothetical protein [Longimicrobiaceae bacterium]